MRSAVNRDGAGSIPVPTATAEWTGVWPQISLTPALHRTAFGAVRRRCKLNDASSNLASATMQVWRNLATAQSSESCGFGRGGSTPLVCTMGRSASLVRQTDSQSVNMGSTPIRLTYAQEGEWHTHRHERVAPARVCRFKPCLEHLCRCSSTRVERLPYKKRVIGSSPVTGTRRFRIVGLYACLKSKRSRFDAEGRH